MSVTRATTATRVNSAGLVELVPYNLLGYSQDFTNASWLKGASTITGNTTTAPDGTLTADTFTVNGSNDLHIVLWQTDVIGVNNTISVYAKKNTNDFLQIYTDFVNTDFANFNLANGTTGSVGSSVISSSIESVGNGWYRCSFVVGSSASKYVNFCLVTSATAGRAETNSLSTSVFLWGAQLNEGGLKDYQKTETRLNIPRLDYSNGTCPSLLVEPQRTNLSLYSEQFDNAGWTKDGFTISANSTTSPNGNTTADKLVANAASGAKIVYQIIISAIGTAYTTSAYFKAGENNLAYIRIGGVTGNPYVIYNLSTQAVVSSGGTITHTIQLISNGWYKISATVTADFTIIAPVFSILPTTGYTLNGSNIPEFTGNGVNGGFIWGAQLEAGSYATSYIPTTSASVTRNADVISKTGISSLIGQTEGSVFLDLDYTSNGTNYWLQLGDNTTNFIELYVAGGVLYFSGYNGSAQWSISTAVSTQHYKIAYAYKANDIALYVNGTLIGTDTSAAIPTCSNLYLNQQFGGLYNQRQFYNAAALWKTRLTNTQLAQLTAL
jgi:hypothetical protein